MPPPRGVSTGAIVGAVAIAALIAAMAASSGRDHDRPPPSPEPRRDQPPPAPTPTRPPDAPRALEPGVAQGAQPTLDCRRGVALRWSPVVGARDYVIVFEVQRERAWGGVGVAPTAAPKADVAAQALAYENRWSVRARGAGGDSAASQTLSFRCDFSGVR
ncbi:MAG: hypothetical protein JO090_04215 [Rhizobacter sp.]|nr:hypothetical protein [Rhizobacter sp.]